ncbi:DNA-binding LacI/PurR family transcriptional regulator [Streptosporangium lutulentum]|uniref:DNA-binding LacI/PurR family transcriptional regulator n=1 Tax=Streptosporangium lutulentum TaxID=1461250 RepID=A0ABT9QCE1_9ACTN|nr:DNA-binding LacI/PurR family transcriptional regulator [Streptosporangium lutulentum]
MPAPAATLGIARGETPEPRRVELSTDLVVRESSAPPAT